MKNLFLPLLFLSLGIYACQSPTHTEDTSESRTVIDESDTPDMPIEMELALEAHGGLDRWRSFNSLEYDLEVTRGESTNGQHSVLDLRNRYERILYENYEIGYNGEEYWYYAEPIQEEHPDPKFYINLQFYFFSLPFVLADPGVNYEVLEQRVFEGKSYNVVKATFNEGVGTASDDQYLLYLDPETQRLALLLYSVTYFNSENATQYNAAVYSDWQQVEGLWVPQEMTSHQWNSDTESIGDIRYIKRFSNVKFAPEAPPIQLFAKPEGAIAS